MSEYKLEVNGCVTLSDYGNIYDYIGIVDTDDKFTIVIDHMDKKNIELIISALKYKNFIITYNGKNNDGKYCIESYKNNDYNKIFK